MIEYLTVEEVISIHDMMIERYGGLHGIRDKNLLLSAVEIPKTAVFGQEMYPSVWDKGAAYLYHIVKNHPFNDANKRTGYTTALVFLEANNAFIVFRKEEYENLVIDVASGVTEKEQIACFFKERAKP
jgi:death-on-curing protein